MTADSQKLRDAVASWPEEDKDELIEIARDIEARRQGAYRATRDELGGIDRGVRDAENGRFASDDDINALRARFRHV